MAFVSLFQAALQLEEYIFKGKTLYKSLTPVEKVPVKLNWGLDYKTFFMLISAGHEILNAHKYKNIKKFSFFQSQISKECHLPF